MASNNRSTKESITAAVEATESRDIYLTPDERYAVWVVKAAERPHLLTTSLKEEEEEEDSDDQQHDEKKEENGQATTMPLQDGCDIPGWRAAGVVTCIVDHQQHQLDELPALLRVGPGCTLTRRESQLSIVSTAMHSWWRTLQAQLLQPVTVVERQARRVHVRDRSLVSEDNNEQQEPQRPSFERAGVPCIVEGCCDDWTAMESCRFQQLVERFGDEEWRFSDTHGASLPLRVYQKYCCTSMDGAATDDAPLAVYDSQFGNRNDPRHCIVAMDEYTVPPCFGDGDCDDLFAATIDDEAERPPYRWILTGPERSGTGLHVDPVGTHAWVALVEGCKRWVLFPPDVDRRAIGMMTSDDDDTESSAQIPSVLWFRDYYEQALRHCPGAIEVLQQPGETVYVPAGWPHLVLNVQGGGGERNNMITAITQNYASECPSLLQLYDAIVQSEPALAERFVSGLRERRPALYERLRLEQRPQQQQQQQQQQEEPFA